MTLEDQIDFFASHPPTHLGGFVISRSPDHLHDTGGHGEPISVASRLSCACGSKDFLVSAYHWQRDASAPAVALSPVKATCAGCGHAAIIFDSRQHGYDPVACGVASTMNGAERNDARPFTASTTPGTVDMIFHYPDDLFEEDFDDIPGQSSDLFTWLTIIVGENTAPDYPLLSFECA